MGSPSVGSAENFVLCSTKDSVSLVLMEESGEQLLDAKPSACVSAFLRSVLVCALIFIFAGVAGELKLDQIIENLR